MTEMLDRITEVIFDGGDSTMSQSREIAINVLKAMREPTIEMCRDAAFDDYGPDLCRSSWQAMIDLALAPPRSP